MDSKTKSLIEKIRALMERTTANGCTEAEAMTAASLAMKLMEKAGLSPDEILAGQSEATDAHWMRKEADHPIQFVAGAVAAFTGTRMYRNTFRDRQTATDLFGNEEVIKDDTSKRIRIIGLAHEVEIASYILDICANAMDTAAAKALQAENDERASAGEPLIYGNERKAWVHDFQRGMAARMSETLREMTPKVDVSHQIEKGNGTSLVLVRNSLIDKWFDDRGIRLGRAGHSPGVKHKSGYQAGHAAGGNVRFHSGVGSGQRAVHQIGAR